MIELNRFRFPSLERILNRTYLSLFDESTSSAINTILIVNFYSGSITGQKAASYLTKLFLEPEIPLPCK